MRLYTRFSQESEVECRIDGIREYVTLYNISCGGCMIETANPAAIVGASIRIELNDVTEMRGEIVWQVGKNIGIKFEVPLHQSAIESMGYSSNFGDFDQHDRRDRYGIPLV
ncbi:MAG: PilZ domain-containing protein [Sphingomonadaceae bacterium]